MNRFAPTGSVLVAFAVSVTVLAGCGQKAPEINAFDGRACDLMLGSVEFRDIAEHTEDTARIRHLKALTEEARAMAGDNLVGDSLNGVLESIKEADPERLQQAHDQVVEVCGRASGLLANG